MEATGGGGGGVAEAAAQEEDEEEDEEAAGAGQTRLEGKQEGHPTVKAEVRGHWHHHMQTRRIGF